MSGVTIHDRAFEVDAIVFDKDGTLLELDSWGQVLEKWGRLLGERLDLPETSIRAIYDAIGYDWQHQKMLPNQPVSVASVSQLMTIASFMLYRAGIQWTDAEAAVQFAASGSVHVAPEPSMLHFIGEVPQTLQQLRDAGIQIGVITNDDRVPTELAFETLNIGRLVDFIICGDDPGPKKPSPHGLFRISSELCVPLDRILMVGDSAIDMRCGRAAGVAGCILVGPGSAERRTDYDVTIGSIDEIKPIL